MERSEIINETENTSGKPEKGHRIYSVIAAVTAAAAVIALIAAGLHSIRRVPPVVGEISEDAKKAVTDAGFSCEVMMQYSSEVPFDTVISQSRTGVWLVQKPVTIVMSLGPKTDLFTMPDLTDLSPAEGVKLLLSNGKKRFTIVPVIGEEEETEESEEHASRILAQSIPVELQVSAATPLTFTFASDGEELIEVINGEKILRISGTEPVEVDYDLLPDAQTEFSGQDIFFKITPDSDLGEAGLAGEDAREITELYIYAGVVGEEYLDCYYTVSDGGPALYVPASDSYLSAQSFGGIMELKGLANLEALCLAGCRLTSLKPVRTLQSLSFLDVSVNPGLDLTALGELEALAELNIAWTSPKNLAVLDTLPSLETVYADSSMRGELSKKKHSFEVIYLDTCVGSTGELEAALKDPSVYDIVLTGNIVIEEGQNLVLPAKVYLCGSDLSIMNSGTLRIAGVWDTDDTECENLGTLTVVKGGVFTGTGLTVFNYGEVNKKGTFLAELEDYTEE